ncbi:MAG: RNB domain-containing ribonuclease [Desulfobacterales bacterium]
MNTGKIVEYIDRHKIICAVVLEVKKQRLRLLNENDREINISESRLTHSSSKNLDMSVGRSKVVEMLKETAVRRSELLKQINILELWEVLNSEQEWIDLSTMTEFCFPEYADGDHESAVVRAFFEDRFYFRFKPNAFFPNTQEQVERIISQAEEEERRNRIIKNGGDWLKCVLGGHSQDVIEPWVSDKQKDEFMEVLKSYYLFEKESPYAALGKALMTRAGIDDIDKLFEVLVRQGVWEPTENVDLHRLQIPVTFSHDIVHNVAELISGSRSFSINYRHDLTDLKLITIDGQSTLDYDDALSIERAGRNFRLGVHIADVGHYIQKDSAIDQEALCRGSSIYMPDLKVPMIPAPLAEDLCSLKEGMLRPAISLMAMLTPQAEVLGFEILPSVIRVRRQLTYFEANLIAETDEEIATLFHLAKNFQQYRLKQGAVQITLPEVNVWLNEEGEPVVTRTNRESPGRMLISEMMIMANWLKAKFLAQHGLPAIFRSQPKPKDRLYKGNEGSVFQNWMQRKLLSRFVLSTKPEHHSGLGLDAYITATSPIRKYFDLLTQRQLRASMGIEEPYSTEDVARIIGHLEYPMSCVSRLQFRRNRYWLLKYLETHVGKKEEAIVLSKRRYGYQILLTEYMIECMLPLSGGINLKPEDMIQVTIQHVNARKDILSVYLG